MKISSVIGEAEKALTIDSEKLKERVAYNTYMEMLDRGFYIDSGVSSLITLKAGQRIVVIRGSSFAVLQGSAIIGGRDQERVVNVSSAGETLTNSEARRNNRYIFAGDGFISIKAISNTVKIAVIETIR